jgi:hypothetical protein
MIGVAILAAFIIGPLVFIACITTPEDVEAWKLRRKPRR